MRANRMLLMKKTRFSVWFALVLGLLGNVAQAGPYPPWSQGNNDPVGERGLEFTVPEVDNLPDFHGNPLNPGLAIFVGGNYFFAMAPLVHAFEALHPELKGRIYYETIPPGLVASQIKKGGTVTVGNMTWTVQADVYAAGLKRVTEMERQGYLEGPVVSYATNTLTIMVPKGNPAHIHDLADLAHPGVALVMPNPEYEGIGRQIKAALKKAGGDTLVQTVYDEKVKTGETALTHIHHRQSPMFLMSGKAQAGVTWISEARFQEMVGNPIEHVDIPDSQNMTAVYAAGVVKGAHNPQAAKAWVDFLYSPQGLAILGKYGFKPYHS